MEKYPFPHHVMILRVITFDVFLNIQIIIYWRIGVKKSGELAYLERAC